MAITDTLNLNAQQVAEQNPELHQMRQKFFGQDYLSDIQKGDTGTVQYYTGLGDPNAINYTEEQTTQPVVDTSTPVVDTGGGGGGPCFFGAQQTRPVRVIVDVVITSAQTASASGRSWRWRE